MNAVAKVVKPAAQTGNFRARNHRISKMPVKDIMRIRMAELDLSNQDVQKVAGYPSANVIAMMKSGSMSLPPRRAVVVADLLQVDRLMLFTKALEEYDSDMADALKSCLKDQPFATKNEASMLDLIRKETHDLDVDLTSQPELVAAVTAAVRTAYKVARKDADQTLKLIDTKKAPKVA